MKLIPLTQNKFAKVDDADFDELNKYKWYAAKARDCFYAQRKENGKVVKMHRQILNVTDRKIFVDHIKHDTLDNQRSELRTCTSKENTRNQKSSKNSTSKYLGVHLSVEKIGNKIYTYWRASIRVGNSPKTLGRFKTEAEAANCYNLAATKYYGEFANLNII